MADWVCRFLREDNGQDLIEYSLLMAFIAIACLALVGAGRPAVNAIWTHGNSQLANAASVATS
jgi:Flp pilus assembly pilin Flp